MQYKVVTDKFIRQYTGQLIDLNVAYAHTCAINGLVVMDSAKNDSANMASGYSMEQMALARRAPKPKYNFVQVTQKQITPYEGNVHDLTVDTAHTYNIDGLVVHNSGAGSLVNYALSITQVNPLDYDLIFER